MKTYLWSLLQLFAEGSGAEGSTTGESAAAAGQHRAQPEAPASQVAAAQEVTGRMTWEQIKSDPEYSGYMQEMVRDRVKNIKKAQSDMQALAPALQLLAKQHGMDPEKPDYAALSRAVTEQADLRPRMQQHFSALLSQSQALQRKFPSFRLEREMQDPKFVKLTSPGTGVSLEDAYYLVHRHEIGEAALRVAAQRTTQQISNAMRAGMLRPEENGTMAAAPSVSSFDYRSASREEREALKSRIRLAGARGEKLYPGDM